MTDRASFESALAAVESDLDGTVRAATALVREVKKAKSAAAVGQVRELRRSLAEVASQIAQLGDQVRNAASGYDIDETDFLSSGSYAKELLAAAAEADVAMFEEDERFMCYPSILRILPADLAVEVDRKRGRALRPSVVVAALKRTQQAGPRFRPEPFLASLQGGYDLVVAQQGKPAGTIVRLVEIYTVLTLLPGQSREYTRPEFARDLYLLDQSNVTVDRSGRRLRWAASTGTKQAGVITTVARTGQQQRYWGVAFEGPR